MRRWLIVFALLACIPQLTWATSEEHTLKHSAEINRLGKLISQQNFEPVTVVVEGKDFAQVIAKTAAILRDHIGLKNLSPLLCDCLYKVNIIPPEHCALLEKWSYTLTESGEGNNKKLTLAISLDSKQLRQLALFEMWPLYGQDFLKKAST